MAFIMKKTKLSSFFVASLLFFTLLNNSTFAAALDDVSSDERCSVCGMFVAKYPAWISQIKLTNGNLKAFDGVKDMMVFYFDPEKYGVPAGVKSQEIWVKDYYSLIAVEAEKAFFVTGSDVYGPMGHEFVPFASKEAAESFMRDHNGKKLLLFNEITAEMVEKMREGNRM